MEEDVLISGGISGAITDIESEEAVAHAYKRYGMIRNSHTDIDKISLNTGFLPDKILAIKNYLFMDIHKLENGYHRFDPDFAIGESWWRLAFDPDNIKPHDITLLKHEFYEMQLIQMGYEQQEAHNLTEAKGYDYQTESSNYYKALEEKDKNSYFNEEER